MYLYKQIAFKRIAEFAPNIVIRTIIIGQVQSDLCSFPVLLTVLHNFKGKKTKTAAKVTSGSRE